METLEDGLYIVIKAYKLRQFLYYHVLRFHSILHIEFTNSTIGNAQDSYACQSCEVGPWQNC